MAVIYDAAVHGAQAQSDMVLRPVKLKLKRLFISRHGESEYNTKSLLGGNSSLSSAGEEYADRLAGVYKQVLEQDMKADTQHIQVWTSTLQRTIQTARLLPYPKKQWKELDEINAGVCEGLTYEDVAEKYPEEYEARKVDKLNYRYPEGESYVDLVVRLKPIIEALEQAEGYVIMVAHQAIARVIFAYLTGMNLESLPVFDIPLHTVFEFTPDSNGFCEVSSFEVPVPCRQVSFRDFVMQYEKRLSSNISLGAIAEAEQAVAEGAED